MFDIALYVPMADNDFLKRRNTKLHMALTHAYFFIVKESFRGV